tara:strand:+ start:1997 stop:2266 length:270 start_codon:yes stop_codon:yes gene_type:complete
MLKKSEINSIVNSAINEVLENSEKFNLESCFIGSDSIIESIDIVQIIAFVEDKLEEKGFEGFDFLEKTFEHNNLRFSDFSDLIEKEIKS